MKKLKVGITGGIGSGKTTVCRIFETLNIPIYVADDRAKALMTTDENLIFAIKKIFGDAAYFADGNLNRQLIAEIAFHNPLKLNELNAVVHPAVLVDGNLWHDAQLNVPYTLKEAALLFESGSSQFLDKIITVFADENTRIERVLLRGQGGISRADVVARMSKQMPEEEKMRRADFVIFNDGEQALIPQVLEIHRSLISFAANFETDN